MTLETIVEERLRSWLPPGSRILVGVSGGPDSVALAHCLKGFSYRLRLAHVDHQMRPGSRRDAEFVKRLAETWDLPVDLLRVHVPSHAASAGLGLEEAARELRYRALQGAARRFGAAAVITAHTADDQAETVLMNLLRGAGPSGLAGIPPRRPLGKGIELLRPLLGGSRREVLGYLRKHRLAFRQDPSNRQKRFTRNRIRLEVLPGLEKRFPGLRGHLVQLADILREEEDFWRLLVNRHFAKTVRKNGKKVSIDLTRLFGYHKALGRRILRRVLGNVPFREMERVWAQANAPGSRPVLTRISNTRIIRSSPRIS